MLVSGMHLHSLNYYHFHRNWVTLSEGDLGEGLLPHWSSRYSDDLT